MSELSLLTVSVVKNPLERTWRGVSPENRVAERRARLLDAALEKFSAQSFTATTVRDVCREAGLTERYFYESFASKDALLGALAWQIIGDFLADAAPSVALAGTDLDATIEGAMRAVVMSLTTDPRRARILFVETVGLSPDAETARRKAIGSLVRVILDAGAQAYGEWARESLEMELIARAVIGAMSELMVSYSRGELPLDQESMVVNLTRILLRARTVAAAIAAERSDHAVDPTTGGAE